MHMKITDTPTDNLDKVSLDLCGPVKDFSDNTKERYVLTIQDGLTKYSMGYPANYLDSVGRFLGIFSARDL